MRSDALLKSILEQTGLPVKQYEYKGTKEEYIVINEEDERGINHADDLPQAVSMWWQVHIFAPVINDYRSLKRQVRKLLMDNGFIVREAVTIYEQETETMHVIISCNIVEKMEE